MNLKCFYFSLFFAYSSLYHPKTEAAALSEQDRKLLLACKTGNKDHFDAALTAGANINAIDPKTKYAAWYIATKNRKTALLDKLFKRGAHFIALPQGESHYSCGLTSSKMYLLQLLKQHGAHPSLNPETRSSDLKRIICSGNFKFLNFAFKNGIFLKTDITDDIFSFIDGRRKKHYQDSAESFRGPLEKMRDS